MQITRIYHKTLSNLRSYVFTYENSMTRILRSELSQPNVHHRYLTKVIALILMIWIKINPTKTVIDNYLHAIIVFVGLISIKSVETNTHLLVRYLDCKWCEHVHGSKTLASLD